MNIQQLKELKRKLYKKLLNSHYLKNNNISSYIIEKHINSHDFINNLEIMLRNEDYSGTRTLLMCEPLLNELSSNPPKDWLNYLYNYVLSKNFKEATTLIIEDSLKPVCELFFIIFKIICEFEKESGCSSWQCKYPLEFLKEDYINALENDEYLKFTKVFNKNYVYEMMKLNGEIYDYNTLDHICGVHYLCMFIATQLKKNSVSIDLGRVSGAAAGHDIGKYGCKGEELKRVPHLHYYYTDHWFKNHGINYIRNVAINHSTWDLELENLSLESLILIYCDFRVKNNGANMHIYSLQESFQVILAKLENLDNEKEKRYRRVYGKLKDFEDYLLSLGINISIDKNNKASKVNTPIYPLISGSEISTEMKFLAIHHNINLMHMLRDEFSLEDILEQARTEIHWKNLRQYIRVLEEYSTYFTQQQKLQTIKFLYENLSHSEDDIRRHCAELIGILIALYDEYYNKEIPKNVTLEQPSPTSYELFDKYLSLILYPSSKIIPSHRTWIGYSAKIMVDSTFSNCKKSSIKKYRDILLKYYSAHTPNNIETQLFLLETAKYIPLIDYDINIDILIDFIISMSKKRNNILRITSLEVIGKIMDNLPVDHYLRSLLIDLFRNNQIRSKNPLENLLLLKIFSSLDLSCEEKKFKYYCETDYSRIPDIFLSNLKTSTNWIRKKIQIELLLNYTLTIAPSTGLHTCIHFCNMLKVSAIESVRNKAGASILKIMPILNSTERNEVAIELLRGLEIEGQKFTEYIPRFLGESLLWLEPKELDEILDDLKLKIKTSNEDIKILILKTIGITIANYRQYENRFNENEEKYSSRTVDMLSIILNGLGNYKSKVKQAAIITLGKDIFGSTILSLTDKYKIFALAGKKILTLISDDSEESLLFLTNAASLNHIYRFIADYNFFVGELSIDTPKNIAFFPGTFDPFSLSHKNIAKTIRDMGFEVYLAVDEFSWSKKTLPNLLRKALINLSICDELHIYVYPEIFQTNIANPLDLEILKNNFKNSKIYFVSGSDVLLNSSCYGTEPEKNSIHSFNHIIFERGNSKQLQQRKNLITGEVKIINLPQRYSTISSTQIRTYIDQNRDISTLIDPLVEEYIYENGFYQREPMEKTSLIPREISFEFLEDLDENIINGLISTEGTNNTLGKLLNSHLEKTAPKIVIIRNKLKGDIIALSSFHWIRSSNVFKELDDELVCHYIRRNPTGRLILIDGFYINSKYKNKFIEQTIITETLAYALSKDYDYTIFRCLKEDVFNTSLIELLKFQGFIEIPSSNKDYLTLVVNMNNPCILNLDVENIMKEPFRSNSKIKQTINATRKSLQTVLNSLYPGELVLSFDSHILHQKMIDKICKENHVPIEIYDINKYGESMCVPYGDILDRYIVPNTITKSLHTEKYYSGDIKSFFIGESPYYLSLDNQVKMIKSFNKPVLLVDNILHKGYRIKALDPLLKREDILVKKFIAGILSGRGKDLMDMQGREVDSVYFIPKFKIWFNENALYPFIGGDGVWRGVFPKRNLIPSINTILPYTYPTFIRDTSHKNIYNLSKVCLENSLDILKSLENEYHNLYGRNLTLATLGEVLTIPRSPEIGKDLEYNLNINPSSYIQKDLELLSRLENIIT